MIGYVPLCVHDGLRQNTRWLVLHLAWSIDGELPRAAYVQERVLFQLSTKHRRYGSDVIIAVNDAEEISAGARLGAAIYFIREGREADARGTQCIHITKIVFGKVLILLTAEKFAVGERAVCSTKGMALEMSVSVSLWTCLKLHSVSGITYSEMEASIVRVYVEELAN